MFNLKRTFIPVLFIALFSSFIIHDEPKKIIIKAPLTGFTTDNLGNIYTLNNEELIKYLPNGKFFARYSNLKLGPITQVDATNPLKLILYYRDFQQIVFLDNQLSVTAESISLEKLGFEQTDLVCASANNAFWIYNKQNSELVRFNENSKKITSTGNLKQILQIDINPNYIIEHNNFLFLNSPDAGIYVFDIFGAFSKIIAIKNISQFQVHDEIIYFKKDSALCSYNYKVFEEACQSVPNGSKTLKIEFNKGRIYSAFKDSVLVH